MFLPPFEKETAAFVPVMSLKYDPRESNFCARIMMLTSANKELPLPCQSIGFRVESPHGSDEGRHNFYHSQMISDFDYGPWKTRTSEAVDWLPTHQPSFPIWATNTVEAVLCLILTLYGRIYYRNFFIAHSRKFQTAITPEFKNLHKKLT